MDKHTAAMTLQFLQRLNLTGAEVPAFTAVINAMLAIANGSMVVAPAAAKSRENHAEQRALRACIAAQSGEE
jgi:hypothetical protein